MKLFAGIDGGQSSTTAVIADEQGRLLGRGRAGAADEVGQGAGSTRLRDALRIALEVALLEARAAVGLRIESVVAGVSGFEGRLVGAPPELPAHHARLTHDAPIAHAGALAGEAGVVVIAGTGSVAYGVAASGESVTRGGWGYLFGDEGSAFWIAREALGRAIRDSNADLERALLAFFECTTLRAIAQAFYAGRMSRTQFAAFAPSAMNVDPSLRKDAAIALVELATQCVRAIVAPATVAFVGGLMNDLELRAEVERLTERTLEGARVVTPRYEPAVGALLLAYRDAGLDVTEISL